MKSMKMFPGYLVSHKTTSRRIPLQLSSTSQEHAGLPLPLSLNNNDLAIFALPNEILCAIFLFARDLPRSSLSESRILNLKELPTEVRISHVCRLWRSIALNFPNLWNTFRYGLPKSLVIEVKGRLDTYLKRSIPQLLDFWLNFRGDPNRTRFNDHNEMLRNILTHSDRWRRLTLLGDDYFPIEGYCRDLEEMYSVNLEHFAFCPQITVGGQGSFFSPKIFKNGADKLTSVRLETNSYRVCVPPFSNLTTLRVERLVSDVYINTSTIISLLTIPSLENLSLSGFGYNGYLDVAKKPIVMKNLRDFRCGDDHVGHLVSFIEAPYLHTLTLKNICIPHFQPNATPSLTTLLLCNCYVARISFIEVLAHVENQIEHLTVSEDSTGDFYRYAFAEFAEGRWKRLRSLKCNIQTITRVDWYIQFAFSRLGTDPFSMYVHGNLLDMWTQRSPDNLTELHGVCDLRPWDDDSPLVPRHWPYGDNYADHPYDRGDYDSFRVVSYH